MYYSLERTISPTLSRPLLPEKFCIELRSHGLSPIYCIPFIVVGVIYLVFRQSWWGYFIRVVSDIPTRLNLKNKLPDPLALKIFCPLYCNILLALFVENFCRYSLRLCSTTLHFDLLRFSVVVSTSCK